MKFQRLAVIVVVASVLASCGAAEKRNSAEDKKKQLADYKIQLKDISGKIEILEKDIAKLDVAKLGKIINMKGEAAEKILKQAQGL